MEHALIRFYCYQQFDNTSGIERSYEISTAQASVNYEGNGGRYICQMTSAFETLSRILQFLDMLLESVNTEIKPVEAFLETISNNTIS
ncbi:hypothetical protein YC2023_039116 [Brassica napus]